VVYTASDTLSTLVDKINADSTLNTEGVSARVVVDGGTLDQFRLEITDSNSDEFSVVETSGGSFLSDTGLKTDTRGLSNRMTIRSDIKENNSFISRGTLQSNTFQSRSLNSKTANFAGTTPTVSAGALTFKIDSSTSVTKTYATTDSLDDVVTAINTDTNLIAANITAEVIIEGSNFKLKVRDNNGDDFMVVDSGGLSLDVSQGISLGDNSVADRMSEIFTTSVAFNAVPAKGARGGLPNSSNTFGEYSAKILSGNSAEALTVQNKLTFQESLQQELSSKNASISGVNMDQELSNLIIFEQAYMAAARIITTTQELFRVLREMV